MPKNGTFKFQENISYLYLTSDSKKRIHICYCIQYMFQTPSEENIPLPIHISNRRPILLYRTSCQIFKN